MKISSRVARVAGATALVVAGLGGITGTANAAAMSPASSPCDEHSVYTPPVPIPAYFTTDGSLQVEPAAECANGTSFIQGAATDVFCYTMNYYDNEWLYVRVGSSGDYHYGWTPAGDVNYDSGATAHVC